MNNWFEIATEAMTAGDFEIAYDLIEENYTQDDTQSSFWFLGILKAYNPRTHEAVFILYPTPQGAMGGTRKVMQGRELRVRYVEGAEDMLRFFGRSACYYTVEGGVLCEGFDVSRWEDCPVQKDDHDFLIWSGDHGRLYEGCEMYGNCEINF